MSAIESTRTESNYRISCLNWNLSVPLPNASFCNRGNVFDSIEKGRIISDENALVLALQN